jgi:CRP/FNR family nitrogen fixation transcriptional regulator
MSVQYVETHRGSVAPYREDRAESAREGLEIDGPRMTYDRDEEIFGEAESADYVYQVVSGSVRTYRLLSDGRRQIEEFHFAGDCFGLEAGRERRTTAEALTETVVKAVRRSALTDLASRDPDMARKLWKLTASDLRRTQDHVLMLGRRSAAERVAGFLIDLARRTGSAHELDLPMSRQDIADYLGLTIETVSRTFTQLQGSGYVAIPSCRHILLSDRQSLVEMCE